MKRDQHSFLFIFLLVFLGFGSAASAVVAQGEPTPAEEPIQPGTDVKKNTDCLGGCHPCIIPTPKSCGAVTASGCGAATCEILFGTPPDSVVVPPVEIFYARCGLEYGNRGTGKQY